VIQFKYIYQYVVIYKKYGTKYGTKYEVGRYVPFSESEKFPMHSFLCSNVSILYYYVRYGPYGRFPLMMAYTYLPYYFLSLRIPFFVLQHSV
jgi:hypothetical protein